MFDGFVFESVFPAVEGYLGYLYPFMTVIAGLMIVSGIFNVLGFLIPRKDTGEEKSK